MWILPRKSAAAGLCAAALFVALSSACGDSPAEAPAPHADRALFLDAARTAWGYADRQYHPETGLINSVAGYPYATVWDIGSGLAALYSANQLGLLPDAAYDARMRRALRTLGTARLFEGTAFNKNYATRSGAFAGVNDRDTAGAAQGYGWSATDLGRLLVWLKVIAVNQPRYAADVQRVVDRLDFAKLVEDGYLWGAERGPAGEVRRHPEGRLGYEQYAAQGFALWGHRAEKALRLGENTFPVTVLDVPLVEIGRAHV